MTDKFSIAPHKNSHFIYGNLQTTLASKDSAIFSLRICYRELMYFESDLVYSRLYLDQRVAKWMTCLAVEEVPGAGWLTKPCQLNACFFLQGN